MEGMDSDFGDLFSVNEGSLVIDDQKLQKSILVPGGQPPGWIYSSPYFSEIAGRSPGANFGVIQIKRNIRRPVGVYCGSLRRKLNRNRNLIDFLGKRDEIGNYIFHIPLSEPENIGIVMVRMSKIPDIIDFSNECGFRSESAGGGNLKVSIMSYFYRSRIGAVVFGLLFQIDQNLVQKYRTSFLVAVRSTFADNCDDACLFQLFDVSSECTIGDIEPLPQQKTADCNHQSHIDGTE